MTEQTAITQYSKIKTYMRSEIIRKQFADVVGNHNAGAYISSVLLAVSASDKLQKCTVQSIVISAMRAATLRLSCDPSTGQAHMVPFKNVATFIIGYKGIYQMAIRTGKYRFINMIKIYEGETVTENRMTGQHDIQGNKRDASAKITGWMLYFQLTNGFSKTFYMTVPEIHTHAAHYSPSYNYDTSAWKTNTQDMEAKTVLKLGLSKWGYLDPNDVMAMQASDEAVGEGMSLPDPASIVEVEKPKRSEAEIMRELYGDPDPVIDAKFDEVKPKDYEAQFWLLVNNVAKIDMMQAQEILNGNKGDFQKSYEQLAKQFPG